MMLVPEKQREFAVEVVEKLRTAGFEAYWAGGCVRDRLLGRAPKDYDVATGAVLPAVRRLQPGLQLTPNQLVQVLKFLPARLLR